MMGFGWDIRRWEKEGMWAFVDVSPDPDGPTAIVGASTIQESPMTQYEVQRPEPRERRLAQRGDLRQPALLQPLQATLYAPYGTLQSRFKLVRK